MALKSPKEKLASRNETEGPNFAHLPVEKDVPWWASGPDQATNLVAKQKSCESPYNMTSQLGDKKKKATPHPN